MGRLSQREENSRATSSYFPRAPAPYPATPPSMDPPTYSCPFYWWDFAPTWLKGKFWLVHQVYPTLWHCNMLLPSTKLTLKNCTIIKHTHTQNLIMHSVSVWFYVCSIHSYPEASGLQTGPTTVSFFFHPTRHYIEIRTITSLIPTQEKPVEIVRKSSSGKTQPSPDQEVGQT